MTTKPTATAVAAALTDMRDAAPLVSCLTNIVAAQWTANVLLAAGANPAMIDNPREAGDFARIAGSLLVNTGTPYRETAEAMLRAVDAAADSRTPWVLDPVGAGALPWRTELARDYLTVGRPAIVRGNASEISGLTGGEGGRGVDSMSSPEAVVDVADHLAVGKGTVVATSGPVDVITDGHTRVHVHNGDPIMTKVTAVGCALGGLMAAFAATTPDRLLAAVAASVLMTVSAEKALVQVSGPGSFAVGLLDALATITPAEIEDKARIS